MLKIKRIYEEYSKEDGYRVLVDRLWPRGVSKEAAKLDAWEKEIAPKDTTRKRFDHEEEKFDSFEKSYIQELDKNDASGDFLKKIKTKLQSADVTLLYGAKNETSNNAVVLKEWLEKKINKED